MITNIHIQLKVDALTSERIEVFKKKTRIQANGYALRYLMKLGLDSYDLVTGKPTELTGLPLDVETILDTMNAEQRERLLDLLVTKLGVPEVARIRSLG